MIAICLIFHNYRDQAFIRLQLIYNFIKALILQVLILN